MDDNAVDAECVLVLYHPWAYQVLLDRRVRRDIPLRQVDPDSVAVDAAVAVEEELQMQLDSVLLPLLYLLHLGEEVVWRLLNSVHSLFHLLLFPIHQLWLVSVEH